MRNGKMECRRDRKPGWLCVSADPDTRPREIPGTKIGQKYSGLADGDFFACCLNLGGFLLYEISNPFAVAPSRKTGFSDSLQ